MPPILIDLGTNRDLIDHDFEGYRLNLQDLPNYAYNLEETVDKVYPDDGQYSFLHAKLFALHNHLVEDFWDYEYNFYYIDKKQQVRRVVYYHEAAGFKSTLMYDIPAHVERAPGHYNLCLQFPSRQHAVISDGTGYLHIIHTDCRARKHTSWKTMHSALVLDGTCFILIDSRLQERGDSIVLHCLLQSVEHNESQFDSVLTWVMFENVGDSWKQIGMRQLRGKGIVHYAAIETSFEAVYVASDHPFKFTMDTITEIVEPPKEEPRVVIYSWLQTLEDITVSLKLPEKFNKNLLNLTIKPASVKIGYADKIFIEGDLKNKIDSELTTYNIMPDGRIDILLTKSDNILWDEFIKGGDKNGEEIMSTSLVEEVHQRLAHLCSETEVGGVEQSVPGLSTNELEECDAASEEDTVLVRFDTAAHEITHKVPLSVHQHIFTVNLDKKEAPCLALRYDVDCCVWQPLAKLPNTDTWPLVHQGTLKAFGYIQSSKENKKFAVCAPDFAYAAVLEASRHVFIYKAFEPSECSLRQRVNGAPRTVRVGQQFVFNFDKYGEVLGVSATNSYLFLLTEKHMVAVQVV